MMGVAHDDAIRAGIRHLAEPALQQTGHTIDGHRASAPCLRELGRSGATRGRRCNCAASRGAARQHLLFCPQYPTGVISSRDNVASSLGRAAKARAATATASSKAVGNQDRVARVNFSEALEASSPRTSASC